MASCDSHVTLLSWYGGHWSRDQPDILTESPSGNVGLDFGAFLILTELLPRARMCEGVKQLVLSVCQSVRSVCQSVSLSVQ